MATKYGIELRKMRLERGETLRDMANKVGLSISYLSSIENGLRNIPSDLTKKIVEIYSLNKEEVIKLENAEKASVKEVKIKLESLNKEQKELALLLSRKLQDVDNAEELIKIILKEGGSE
jgi:transcriptional regulator with XRE-family HTH domain